ncbi:hypothetical protein [Sphingomonas bacterium]|uniref:hypothetical protein n=1 Tax=Sphingomonas bacterium TaxID=1895847 RepID=UPI0015770C7C|nr:hypothetical protein [Sphingomonas bacterium]
MRPMLPLAAACLVMLLGLSASVLAGGDGPGIEVLTRVPIGTPFAVLAGLGTGVLAWDRHRPERACLPRCTVLPRRV